MIAFPGTRRPAPADAAAEPLDRQTFTAAGKAQRESLSALAGDLVRHLRRGRLSESLSALTHLAPLALSAAPYLVALQAQHKDSDLLEAASLRFLGRLPEEDLPSRKAWFTETPEDDGALLPLAGGHEWVAITCGAGKHPSGLPVRSFEPLLELPLPGDGSRPLRVPPLLEILDLCERERYTEILISTPGPLGLAGLIAGKLLGIRTAAVYDAGFPLYLQYLAGSPALEELAWACMRWFCGQMDCVHVEGHAYHDLLVRRGFDPARMRLLPVERSRMAG